MDAISKIELANYEKVEPPKMVNSNFMYSFSLLPREERKAINTIYAFCSYIDDIVDTESFDEDGVEKRKERLLYWENVIEDIYRDKVSSPLLLPLVHVVQMYNLPKQYFLTLIDGVRRDLVQNRYSTFEELKQYCYGVAGVVGLISIEIFGYKYEETKNYAINLGYALQLTNILRDVKNDKDRGYIYLPQEDLQRFSYSEDELLGEVYNDNFIELMRFEANRVRNFYHTARKALHPEERLTIVTAEAMDAIYYRLLEKIELYDFNVFGKKIRVSNLHKIMIAMKHWMSVRVFVRRLKKK